MKKMTDNLRRLAGLSLLTLASTALVACGDDDKKPEPVAYQPGDCDPLMGFACSLPWPSNLYLAENDKTETGYSLNFGEKSLPATRRGVHISPEQFRTLDGYGPSSPILFHFPKLDRTGWAHELDMSASVQDNDAQALLLRVNADGTTTRVPYWVEEDLNNPKVDERIVFLRPAVILEEGTRYIVAFRNLKDTTGAAIPRSEAFEALVSGLTSQDPELVGRQERFDEIFQILENNGIAKNSLTLAWDFVTASSSTLHGPVLAMRDAAIEALETNDGSLTFTEITEYQRDDASAPNYDARIAYQFYGTFQTPNFMKEDGLGTILNRNADGVPVQNGWREEEIWVRIPWSAVGTDADPAGIIQYGHGLNGKGSQVRGGFNNRVANEYNYIHFGTDWTGMSEDDISSILAVVADFSNFRWLSDRMNQGLVEFVSIARIMKKHFATHPDVVSRDIQVEGDRIFYTGISQGGIYGASYLAISPDINYGHLGVPGLNYSILLQRSVDFDTFNTIVKSSYTTTTNIAMVLAAVQNLWDMSDPSSYVRHLSADPFPGNEPKAALFVPAKGDWQVSPLTNLIAANSNIGIALMPGWGQDVSHMGLEETPYETDGQPYTGSAVVMYNLGNPWPAPGNITPHDDIGDPHGTPRFFPAHQEQMIHFLENNGEVIDVCNGNGCNFSRTSPTCNDREICWEDD